MNTIRYVLAEDLRYVYETEELRKEDRFNVPHDNGKAIFVDILQLKENSTQLKLYFPNGDIRVCWVTNLQYFTIVKINNPDLLFDGRFNS